MLGTYLEQQSPLLDFLSGYYFKSSPLAICAQACLLACLLVCVVPKAKAGHLTVLSSRSTTTTITTPRRGLCFCKKHLFAVYFLVSKTLSYFGKHLRTNIKCLSSHGSLKNGYYLGKEPWFSGYGRRLMFQRSWVRIPAPDTGWT